LEREFQGPQPSPALGDALNAGYRYLEVSLGCNMHQTVALNIVRRPKTTPIYELERYMRCKDCSEVRRHLYERSHLVALQPTKIFADDPPSTWWPGERCSRAGGGNAKEKHVNVLAVRSNAIMALASVSIMQTQTFASERSGCNRSCNHLS
jgi:hypothetical protein